MGEEEYENISPEEEDEMDDAEEEMVRRQAIANYAEAERLAPASEEELINKLFEVDSRLSVEKKLQKIKDRDGIEREIGIESVDDYPEPFNNDMPKADLTDDEIRSLWGHMTLINLFRTIGKAKRFPFQNIVAFNNAQKDSLINLTRGRAGFSVIMSRTRRSQAEGTIEHVKKQIKDKKEKGWRPF